MAIDYKSISGVVSGAYEHLPTTTLTIFNPISSKGTIDTTTGIRNGSSSSATVTVVDLGDINESKQSIQSNEISETEVFILSEDIPAGIQINSSSVFTLYEQDWSYVSMENVPGNVCIFLKLRKVGG